MSTPCSKSSGPGRRTFDPCGIFDKDNLLQIAMPIGGIGAGSISLNGCGGLQDISVHHRPTLTALPDGHSVKPSGFATLHTASASSQPTTRLLEGPLPPEKIYDQGLQAQGYRNVGHAGLPRMANASFTARYPSGTVSLSDPDVPLAVTLTGWSPFIPLDDHHSSMPAVVLDYELHNPTGEPVDYAFAFHLSHLAVGAGGERNTRNRIIPSRGVLMNNVEDPQDPTFGSCSLTCAGHTPAVKAMWLRGQWFDWMSALWRELSTGEFQPNEGGGDRAIGGPNGGSIQLAGRLEPGQRITYPIVITWHFPNADLFFGQPKTDDADAPCCECGHDEPAKVWHPYYAAHWQDAADVADTMHRELDELRSKTFAFREALHTSTLPPEVIDAIACNLAILKSPTVLRQANGNIWAWEGCFPGAGCCPGSCTHVWNYAQAMPHLFPALERTLREQELERSMDEHGHVAFRAALPDGPTSHTHHPAADGQLGGIMKVFRDWQISGDEDWLRRMYPLVKRSLDYCIDRWDPDHLGAVIEPHHNTYDIEFWGPDGMCTTVYVGALAAMSLMAKHLGHAEEADRYVALAEKGAAYLSEHLFNGEYYHQQVRWEDLRDESHRKRLQPVDGEEQGTDAALLKVLAEEGPQYQYGDGCISDGVIGAWMAELYGIAHPIDAGEILATLEAIHRHNFKADLWGHACTQRPGYAMGHEPGLLLCTWPRGQRPTFPFVYSDEVWTGIEYQVACHLMLRGRVEQGLDIVRGARSRHDGRVRNPFNEYECGSFYARAMASYALLQALSGFAYSAVTRTLRFGPRLADRPWRSFFCAADGYGVIELDEQRLTVTMLAGTLAVDTLELDIDNQCRTISVDRTATVDQPLVIETQ